MSGVLVVRPSSLGDIVHALALVADIRAHRPELAIDWVAEEAFVPLVTLDRDVRRAIPVALRRWRHAPLAPETWREIALARRDLRRESYGTVLDLQEQVKGALIARFALGRRHGPDRASIREPLATLLHDAHHRVDPAQHLIDRCRQLAAAALGYTLAGPPRFRIVPPPPSPQDSTPDRPYVVFVHGTSRPDKLWPEAHWRALLAGFARDGLAIVLPWGSEGERARSERLAAQQPAAIVPPRQTLPQLAGLLARALLVVGVDTGLVHLSAALGTPTVSLFVATDPALAGVAHASPNARDLGDVGRTPAPDEVESVASTLLRNAPHH